MTNNQGITPPYKQNVGQTPHIPIENLVDEWVEYVAPKTSNYRKLRTKRNLVALLEQAKKEAKLMGAIEQQERAIGWCEQYIDKNPSLALTAFRNGLTTLKDELEASLTTGEATMIPGTFKDHPDGTSTFIPDNHWEVGDNLTKPKESNRNNSESN